MGEYAQDCIEAGMMEEYPFGSPRSRRGRAWPRSRRKPEPPQLPETLSDDHFSWWYDELRGDPSNDKMSEYEVAAMAWHEAVRRLRTANNNSATIAKKEGE